MLALRAQFIDTKLSYHFRKPSFRVAVLFVDEKEVLNYSSDNSFFFRAWKDN
jgi:hypothetical protein